MQGISATIHRSGPVASACISHQNKGTVSRERQGLRVNYKLLRRVFQQGKCKADLKIRVYLRIF